MAIERKSDRKVYSFKSVGKSAELQNKLARSIAERPPVGIKLQFHFLKQAEAF